MLHVDTQIERNIFEGWDYASPCKRRHTGVEGNKNEIGNFLIGVNKSVSIVPRRRAFDFGQFNGSESVGSGRGSISHVPWRFRRYRACPTDRAVVSSRWSNLAGGSSVSADLATACMTCLCLFSSGSDTSFWGVGMVLEEHAMRDRLFGGDEQLKRNWQDRATYFFCCHFSMAYDGWFLSIVK